MTDSIDAPTMRWWGWGDPTQPAGLPPHALNYLRETVGIAPRPRPPVALERVQIAPSALSASSLAALREVVGEDGVRDDHATRVVHAAGKGYPDLVRLRAGEPEGAPDAIVYPADSRAGAGRARALRTRLDRRRPLRRRHERRRRRRAATRRAGGRDRARHAPHGQRRRARPRVADRRRTRRHARPRPGGSIWARAA